MYFALGLINNKVMCLKQLNLIHVGCGIIIVIMIITINLSELA